MPGEPLLRDRAREAVGQCKLLNRQQTDCGAGQKSVPPAECATALWRKTRWSLRLSLLGTEARLISTGITSTSGASQPGSWRAWRATLRVSSYALRLFSTARGVDHRMGNLGDSGPLD